MTSESVSALERFVTWLKLSALSARRTLPGILALAVVASALVALRGDFGEAATGERPAGLDLARLSSLAASDTEPSGGALRFLYASQGLLALLFFALAPFLVWRAANRASGSTRRADAHWLDLRPVSSGLASSGFLSTAQWAGNLKAAILCLGIVVIAIAVRRPEPLTSVEIPAGQAAGPPTRLFAEQDLHWTASKLPAADHVLRARLSLRLIPGGSDPVLNVEFAARRSGETEWTSSLARIGDGAPLALDLPPGSRGAEFALRRVEGGARALLRTEDVQLSRSAPWLTGLFRTALRFLAALSAALALALGFAAFVSGPSAAAAAALPWGLALLSPATKAFRFLPGGDLPAALETWTEGRTLAKLAPEAWLGWSVLVVLGLALATLGRRRPVL